MRAAQVRERLARQRPDSVGLSLITWGELLYGAARGRYPAVAREKLDAIVELISVLPLPKEVAEHCGDIRLRWRPPARRSATKRRVCSATVFRYRNHKPCLCMGRARVL